jgi:hypothetical protein
MVLMWVVDISLLCITVPKEYSKYVRWVSKGNSNNNSDIVFLIVYSQMIHFYDFWKQTNSYELLDN